MFNIGNHQPVALGEFIRRSSRRWAGAIKNFLPMQPGDVHATYADTQQLADWVGLCPTHALKEGIARFVAWYLTWREQAFRR